MVNTLFEGLDEKTEKIVYLVDGKGQTILMGLQYDDQGDHIYKDINDKEQLEKLRRYFKIYHRLQNHGPALYSLDRTGKVNAL